MICIFIEHYQLYYSTLPGPKLIYISIVFHFSSVEIYVIQKQHFLLLNSGHTRSFDVNTKKQ